jgi:hypothetical protein
MDSIIGVRCEDFGDVFHQAVHDMLHALTAASLVRRSSGRAQRRGNFVRVPRPIADMQRWTRKGNPALI